MSSAHDCRWCSGNFTAIAGVVTRLLQPRVRASFRVVALRTGWRDAGRHNHASDELVVAPSVYAR